MKNTPEMFYLEDSCHRYTFDAIKVRDFVGENISGLVLNLFAGKNGFPGIREVRVDSDTTMPDLDYGMDASEALVQIKDKGLMFDSIIYDPPWNERKSKEFYGGRYIGKFTKLKEDIVSVLKVRGRIISCGYYITEFGRKRGFVVEKIGVVNPFGEIRPYFVSVERKYK